MTKRAKQVLFYSAVAVFLIASYIIILYAQGYKYSFSDNRFYRTGAVYLKTNTSADVYLDDKLLGNTSFFNNSYRLEGLLPDRYTVRVQKNNYSTWEKSVTVDEGFVSEFSKILLISETEEGLEALDKELALVFPAPTPSTSPSPTLETMDGNARATKGTAISTASTSEPFVVKRGILSTTAEEPERIADNVKGFVLSKDKNKLAWWTANEIWVMWLNDANYQPYHKRGDKELITRFSIQIKKAAWFRDDDHLLVDSNGYKILEIDTRGGINIIEV